MKIFYMIISQCLSSRLRICLSIIILYLCTFLCAIKCLRICLSIINSYLCTFLCAIKCLRIYLSIINLYLCTFLCAVKFWEKIWDHSLYTRLWSSSPFLNIGKPIRVSKSHVVAFSELRIIEIYPKKRKKKYVQDKNRIWVCCFTLMKRKT